MQALIKNDVVFGLMDCDTPNEIARAIKNTGAQNSIYIGDLDVTIGDIYNNGVFTRNGDIVPCRRSYAEMCLLLDDAIQLLVEGGIL